MMGEAENQWSLVIDNHGRYISYFPPEGFISLGLGAWGTLDKTY